MTLQHTCNITYIFCVIRDGNDMHLKVWMIFILSFISSSSGLVVLVHNHCDSPKEEKCKLNLKVFWTSSKVFNRTKYDTLLANQCAKIPHTGFQVLKPPCNVFIVLIKFNTTESSLWVLSGSGHITTLTLHINFKGWFSKWKFKANVWTQNET